MISVSAPDASEENPPCEETTSTRGILKQFAERNETVQHVRR